MAIDGVSPPESPPTEIDPVEVIATYEAGAGTETVTATTEESVKIDGGVTTQATASGEQTNGANGATSTPLNIDNTTAGIGDLLSKESLSFVSPSPGDTNPVTPPTPPVDPKVGAAASDAVMPTDAFAKALESTDTATGTASVNTKTIATAGTGNGSGVEAVAGPIAGAAASAAASAIAPTLAATVTPNAAPAVLAASTGGDPPAAGATSSDPLFNRAIDPSQALTFAPVSAQGGAASGANLSASIPARDFQFSANPNGEANRQVDQRASVGGAGLNPALTSRSTPSLQSTPPDLTPQQALDAYASGAIATDFNRRDAMTLVRAGVDAKDLLGVTPAQVSELGQMIAAADNKQKDALAIDPSTLTASADSRFVPRAAGLPGDDTELARLPGVSPGPTRVPGPVAPKGRLPYPDINVDRAEKLDSWSTNAEIKRSVTEAVSSKGRDPSKTTGENIKGGTEELLDQVNPMTKLGLQMKTGFKPDALYPLGGAAQYAVIKEGEPNQSSFKGIRRLADALRGKEPEPLTATEAMTQYDKGKIPKAQGNTDRRVVGSTAGDVTRDLDGRNFRSGEYSDDLSATSRSVVEAQRRDGPGLPWVRDPSAIVSATETTTQKTKPLDAVRTKFDTYVLAEERRSTSSQSSAQPGGRATVTTPLNPTPSTDPENYIPRGMRWEDLSGDRIDTVKNIKVVTTGVALYPSNIGLVSRPIEKFNNPPIREVPVEAGSPNWVGNGVKTLEVQKGENFNQAFGAPTILTEGYGSWRVGPGVVDQRGPAGRWGPYQGR